MRAVVAYESVFEKTHVIAEEIGSGLTLAFDVCVGSIDDTTPGDIEGADLVVVGGPTPLHDVGADTSRGLAAQRVADDRGDLDAGPASGGLREWVMSMPRSKGQLGAAFDTRLDRPAIFTRSTGMSISRRLHKHGYQAIVDPESFQVDGTNVPRLGDETERARAWGEYLAERCVALMDGDDT